MSNMLDYVRKNMNTLDQEPFNELDALVLSALMKICYFAPSGALMLHLQDGARISGSAFTCRYHHIH